MSRPRRIGSVAQWPKFLSIVVKFAMVWISFLISEVSFLISRAVNIGIIPDVYLGLTAETSINNRFFSRRKGDFING
jgi:hypothetical protein